MLIKIKQNFQFLESLKVTDELINCCNYFIFFRNQTFSVNLQLAYRDECNAGNDQSRQIFRVIDESFPVTQILSVSLCRCSRESFLTISEACVPLLTFPETAPLTGALLQQPDTCVRTALSEGFLVTVSQAYYRYTKIHDRANLSVYIKCK